MMAYSIYHKVPGKVLTGFTDDAAPVWTAVEQIGFIQPVMYSTEEGALVEAKIYGGVVVPYEGKIVNYRFFATKIYPPIIPK